MKSLWKLVLAMPFLAVAVIFLYDVFVFIAVLPAFPKELIEAFMTVTVPAEILGWGIGLFLVSSWRKDNPKQE